MYAEFIYALHNLCKANHALEAKRKLLSTVEVVGHFSSLRNSVRRLEIHFKVQNVKHTSVQSFEVVTLNFDPIFPVRLFCKQQLEHIFCVDTKKSPTVDCCKCLPMLLTTESLFLCVGGSIESSRIGDVRYLA